MAAALPQIYLARHGETAWSLSGQHTGRTDIPLTPHGETNARHLAERLRGRQFSLVLSSPLQRARRTAELAGFGASLKTDPDLSEWNYGDYEGRKSIDIRKDRPTWYLFRDGCPGGESPEQVGARADHVIARLRAASADCLVFSHGHFLRVLAARWLAMPPGAAARFLLSTAALSILGYEHTLEEPAIRLWNDVHHVTN